MSCRVFVEIGLPADACHDGMGRFLELMAFLALPGTIQPGGAR